MPTSTLAEIVSRYGALAKAKLDNPGATGEPEDQLRAPFERLIEDISELVGLPKGILTAVGETTLADLHTRPDYSITIRGALVGHVEIKAPSKGADPRRYKGHDKEQWEKLQSLPNLIYTDGNQFSLWRNGALEGSIQTLIGEVENAGTALAAPPGLEALFDDFLKWAPIAPRSVAELAAVSARLCRLLRAEVIEQLAIGSAPLRALAVDWRKLLFPEADDPTFADGYAQAVTFGLLVARARDIRLAEGLDQVGKKLGTTNSLIGAALRLLTDDAENQATLKTSLGTLVRVLDVVQWDAITKGKPEAWLYFYEDILRVYDNDLRKKTGSYYTPPEVVEAMVRLVDDVLRADGFQLSEGLASKKVTIADPAVGTGTYLLGILRKIAETVEADSGPGAVPGAIEASMKRLIGFEMQLGPFAVAQLRIQAELAHLIHAVPKQPLRMYVTDTLDSPYAAVEGLGSLYLPIAESRKQANKVKAEESITVVIGNPPYKEKALKRGGWIVEGSSATNEPAPSMRGCPQKIGSSARTSSTCTTSTSTSGAGRR